MALDSTVGGASANSYVSQAAATAYLAGRLNVTDWTSASSAEKDAALMMATVLLDAQDYDGVKVSTTQRLQWPRYSTYDRDGWFFASDAIPLLVQQATFEYALALLREPTLLDDSGLEGFANVRLGSLDVTPRPRNATTLPALVRQLLAPVLAGGGSSVHVARA
jgi:Putative DnaT-like ssDNA binding protein